MAEGWGCSIDPVRASMERAANAMLSGISLPSKLTNLRED